MTARMRIVEDRAGEVTILRLIGRFELEEGIYLFRDRVNALLAEGRAKIVLDFKQVTRIDSAGIGMLVAKYLSARRRGGTIKLIDLTRRSDHVMYITRLNTIFEIFDNEAAALSSFGTAAT